MISFADIALLNAQLKESGTRYRLLYQNEETAGIEPPGECCLTPERTQQARDCIERYFGAKGETVLFSDDFLRFRLAAGKNEHSGKPEQSV